MRALLLALALSTIAAPVCAAPDSGLDRLVDATGSSAGGMALARREIGSGALLEALATLERLILIDPGDDRARLLHAGVLCMVDDRQGSLIEFDQLRGHPFSKAEWAEATAPCGQAKGG